jgi:HD-like signal output (HDOD) protein
MDLSQLLAQPFEPPGLPKTEVLLMAELDEAVPDMRRIDQLVAMDPALTLRLLQAANARALGLSGSVHGVSEALALLSVKRVRHVLAEQAQHSAQFGAVPGVPLPLFWRYSLDCAKLARSLAAFLRLNEQAAYTSGLLHALGLLLMRRQMPQAVALDAQLAPMALLRARLEHHVLGFCFTQVSAALAQRALLPQVVVDALAHQHQPFDNDAYEPLAGVLHLAVWRARSQHAKLAENQLTVTFPAAVAEVLGLDVDMVLQQDPIDWTSASSMAAGL